MLLLIRVVVRLKWKNRRSLFGQRRELHIAAVHVIVGGVRRGGCRRVGLVATTATAMLASIVVRHCCRGLLLQLIEAVEGRFVGGV